MSVHSTGDYSPYGAACVRCNDSLIAPDRSKYVSEWQISHSWSCQSCGHQFETSHHLLRCARSDCSPQQKTDARS